MKKPRIDIGTIRREQIVDAAVAVIAEQGLQNLSLSEIEKKVGMSRGQLTYYFRAKEEILLAVFDRLVYLMCKQQGADPDEPPENHPFARISWIEVIAYLLQMLLQKPTPNPEFNALQYTFLSQVGHRPDFRERLAKLYEGWRTHGAEHLARDLAKRPSVRPVSPRAVATLVQAILHGLVQQAAVEPDAFDAGELAELCLDMLSTYLWQPMRPAAHPAKKRPGPTKYLKDGANPNGTRPVANGVKK